MEHQHLQKVASSMESNKSVLFLPNQIPAQRAFLEVYLTDGSNIGLDIQTSDTAERILEVALWKMGLSRYFSLFSFQDHDGDLSVLKKVADFELPYVSLQSVKELCCKLGIRKRVLQRIVKKTYWSSDLSKMIQAHGNVLTKQAFLLSSCLKKMISEQMLKEAKGGQEMEIKVPDFTKNSKKSSIQQKQVVHSGFISRKRFLVRPNEEDCVFEKIREGVL